MNTQTLLAVQTVVDWLRRIVGPNPFYRRRLAERVLRRLGASRTRACALARHVR